MQLLRCSSIFNWKFCRQYSLICATKQNTLSNAIMRKCTRKYVSKKFDILKNTKQYAENTVPFERMPQDEIDPEDAACIAELERGVPRWPPTKARNDPSRYYINRDPHKQWDFPAERRNIDEPLPRDYFICSAEMADPLSDVPLWHSVIIVSSVFLGAYVLYAFADFVGTRYDPWFQTTVLAKRETIIPFFDEFDPRRAVKLVDKHTEHM